MLGIKKFSPVCRGADIQADEDIPYWYSVLFGNVDNKNGPRLENFFPFAVLSEVCYLVLFMERYCIYDLAK